MHRLSLTALSAALSQKKCSSVELTQHFLQRIRTHDPKLNSFITISEASALAAAQAADAARAKQVTHPLAGIPIALKDIFCTDGIKTTCGSKMLEHFIAPYDATAVQALKAAQLILIGKTNMDEFAMGSSNENSYFGPVCNPWDLTRTSGGSSGGSAAAVAARLAPCALGTDTGGSVRQPAALCGITGLKPTYGRVSRFGMIAYASSLDQAGIFATSAEDVALLLNIISGVDPHDATSAAEAVPDYTQTLTQSLQGLRIGLPREFFKAGLDPAVEVCLQAAIREFEKLGATCQEISLPHSDSAVAAYYIIAPAECSANLARFDGVRYGYRCENPHDLMDLYCRSRGEGFGAEVKRRILIGTYVLSSGYYDAYYGQAQKVRQLIIEDYQSVFNSVDVILSPVTPSTAFKIGEKISDPVSLYLEDIYTIPVNLAGLPAIALPAGFSHGLPVGLQLTGNHFSEARILNIGHQFQMNTDHHQKIPEAFL